ncbi:hypothetical protein CY35_05G079400 [Sphagnum magellanicum]|nr:hypothetical protein CY35_05G079400 [Sphagnum magellanicum]
MRSARENLRPAVGEDSASSSRRSFGPRNCDGRAWILSVARKPGRTSGRRDAHARRRGRRGLLRHRRFLAQESSQLREQVLGTQHSGRKIGRRLVGGVLRGGSGRRRRRRRRRASVTPESTRRTLVDGMHLDACLERQERTLVVSGLACHCCLYDSNVLDEEAVVAVVFGCRLSFCRASDEARFWQEEVRRGVGGC